ncbi:MAG: cation diffusion facilitator family transporter [Candidatus Dadabacteria bacterium]|nr:MAG: cation diffusion facilitator family transporter [Candidatus Dadabacteria bacterium]
MPHSGSVRAILYALGANLGIAAAKFVAAGLTGSGALLAEGVHSLADCANQGLLFLGLARARRPPDADHPLGHGKALYFWSFVVALMLFSMGGLFSVYEGFHKLGHPAGEGHGLDRPWIAVVVLLLGLVLEGLSLTGALRETRDVRRGRTLWRWFRESRRSELLVVVGEDLGALLGLSIALVAVGLAVVTGNPAWDAWGSVGVGGLLIVIALAVAGEVKGLLIGESAGPEFERGVRSFLVAHPAVADVLNLITLQLGPDVMVAVKARMAPAASATALVEAINACERDLKRAFPQVRWLFFEPDVLP